MISAASNAGAGGGGGGIGIQGNMLSNTYNSLVANT